MRIECNRCTKGVFVDLPEFNVDQKRQLMQIPKTERMRFLASGLQNNSKKLTSIKFILKHINETYGKCHRCNYGQLNTEYQLCPKCKALNFNWKV